MLFCPFLKQDLKARELKLLAAALFLAVVGISSISLLSARLQKAFSLETNATIGADLLIISAGGFDEGIIKAAQTFQLRHAQTVTLTSMVGIGNEFERVTLRGFDPYFPLRGTLVAQPLKGKKTLLPTHVSPEKVWVDKTLAQRHNLQIGDSIRIGTKTVTVEAVIDQAPSLLLRHSLFSPSIILPLADLYDTGLIDPYSQIRYIDAFAGTPENLAAFIEEITPFLSAEQRIETVENLQPQLLGLLERFNSFMHFMCLVSLFLVGLTLILCIRRFVNRHIHTSAMLRCLGMSRWQIVLHFGGELCLIGLGAILLGCLVGGLLQCGITILLQDWWQLALPPASGKDFLSSFIVALVLLVGFSLSPLLQLSHQSIGTILRKEDLPPFQYAWFSYGVTFFIAILVIGWQLEEKEVIFLGIGSLLGAMGLYLLISLSFFKLFHRFAVFLPLTWRLAATHLIRRRWLFALQTVSLALGLTFLALVVMIRNDLIPQWTNLISPTAPNYFIDNILPHQKAGMMDFFKQHQIPSPTFYPMLRTHLVAINKQPISSQSAHLNNSYAKRVLDQGFFLTWTPTLPPKNEIIQGEWINTSSSHAYPICSLESEFAEKLKIQLGDHLTFETAETQYEAVVGSIRSLEWSTLEVNFYVIFPSHKLDHLPHSFVLSTYLPEEKAYLLNQLLEPYANFTIYPVGDIVTQIQTLIDKVAWVTQSLFWWVLGGGILVIMAASLSLQGELSHCIGLLRALGMPERQIKNFCLIQLMIIGSLGAFITTIGLFPLGAIIGHQLMESTLLPGLGTLIVTLLISCGLIFLANRSSIRTSLSQSISKVLHINY